MAYYFYGIRAVLVAGVSCLSSVAAEYFCSVAMKKKYDWTDVSPIMSGLLLALLMPASVPYSVMAFSSAFMAIICKQAFGGNRNLIFCPVCIAYIFTIFCFPSDIVRYPVPEPFGSVSLTNTVTDTLTRSYTYYLDNGGVTAMNILDVVWGKLAGPMGASAAIVILICAVALYFFQDIPALAFFSGFGANVLINVMFPVGEAGILAVMNSLVAGSFLFVLVFMACDPRYVPNRAFSQILYGVLFATLSYVIRLFTGIENGAVFALPILCVFRDEFDRLTDALERLLKFLWAHLRSGTAFLWDKTKIAARLSAKYASVAAKWLMKRLDALFENISDRIVEASKNKDKKKEDEKPQETEDSAEVTSEEAEADGPKDENPADGEKEGGAE